MKMIALILSSLALAGSVHAADIDGASCVSDALNADGLRYVVEIGEAMGQPGEFWTSVNKYYKRGDRYPEISYNGNSKLDANYIAGKIETGFFDRSDASKFSLIIASGLTIAADGVVVLEKKFDAKLQLLNWAKSDIVTVHCIH